MEMEPGRRSSSDDKYYYTSTLTLCVLSSLGICFSFLQSLPVNSTTGISHSEATFAASRIALSLAVLGAEFQMIRFIRSKDRFHQKQVVFWPMRCRHCARALGLLQPLHHVPKEDPQSLPACRNQTRATSREVALDPSLSRSRSLVDVLIGLCCLAIFTVPVFAVGKITCITGNSNESLSRYISGEILDLVLLMFLPVGISLCYKYFDAFLVTNAENTFTIVIVLSVTIWISVWKMVLPVSELLGEEGIDSFCRLNGTFGIYIRGFQRAMTTFYMECAIIATGLLWQSWNSFIPKSAVQAYLEMPRFDAFPEAYTSTSQRNIARYITSLAFFCRFRGTRATRNEAIDGSQPSVTIQLVNKTWAVSLVIAVVYFASNLFFRFEAMHILTTEQYIYVLYCLEMAFYLPILMTFFHMYISSYQTITPTGLSKDIDMNCLPLEGHDVLLLLCTCGIFCQCFIRVTASIGLFVSGQYVHPDQTALFIFALVYSIVILVMVWCTTSFLLRVQRRPPQPSDVKCVLALLIYIAVSFSTGWLIESLYIEAWTVQALYFGKTTGKVIGVLLDPFATLYGIHSAMVAYEAYKHILKIAIEHEKQIELQIT